MLMGMIQEREKSCTYQRERGRVGGSSVGLWSWGRLSIGKSENMYRRRAVGRFCGGKIKKSSFLS